MPASSTVRFDHVAGPISILRQRGAAVDRMLQRTGLPTMGLGDPDLRVSAAAIYRFLSVAAETEDVPELGVSAAHSFRPMELRWSRVALTTSTSLADAVQGLTRTSAQESDGMRLWLETCTDGAWLCYRGSLPIEVPGAEIAEQFMLQLFVRFVRACVGRDWRPSMARMQSSSKAALQKTEAFAESELNANASSSGVLLHTPLLRRRLPGLPTEPRPEDDEATLAHGLRARLFACIGSPEEWPNVDAAAGTMGTSTRTLQRRLAQAGLSYFELVDRLRRDLAAELVANPDRPLTEIALELGYADSAHFSRAFRRWFGTTPTRHRRGD